MSYVRLMNVYVVLSLFCFDFCSKTSIDAATDYYLIWIFYDLSQQFSI